MARRKAKPARSSGGAKIASEVFIGRTEGHAGFEACIKIGRLQNQRVMGRGWVCAPGSNPRKALAKALRTSAKQLSHRKGAFGRK